MILGKFLAHRTVQKIKYLLPNKTLHTHKRLLSVTNTLATKDSLNISSEKTQKYLESLRVEFYNLRTNPTPHTIPRLNQLDGVVSALEQYRLLKSKLASKEDIENEKDVEMRQLLEEENEVYGDILRQTEETLLDKMLMLAEEQTYNSLIFEVNAGAGGQEAMLFARELFDMYTNFFDYNGWSYEIIDNEETGIGGLRHGNVIVQNREAFNQMQYEGGVHRVQRVPATEKSGRIHTSTASVTVIPRPDNVNIIISEKDLKIETKRASGAGGQHVNTTDSAVRVVHLPTGLAVECQTERSQIKNRERAIQRLQAKLVQRELESKEADEKRTRKAQQGNLNRNEKIRTYNFVQDRITDHRISNGTVHNLEEFFEGGEGLERLIKRVAVEYRRAKLVDLIDKYEALVAETEKGAKKNVNE
ncbi:PREDICTED: peptide chain release factor 1-like, mitochondrial isoform X1 [Bactrocera latifrons]|uniref:Peptide chain release factor 1-like, mitochondrial n=1 Tax=Bactrocera latifrons TaxID=174628 RepID=A0A0K8UJT2_BACLA|nr:PREDICTED: peptide chain release factor 1-like, mitochondrial isoform X1 [Bactrocera latifrons]